MSFNYARRARAGSRGLLCTAALFCALQHTGLASAQSDEERAGARAAATEGAKALQEQRWADAADLFGRAESLVHAPPHLLYLARAQVELGQLVKARENLLKVVRETIPATAPKAFTDAQAQAKAELSKLEARIPYVTISVSGAASGVAVTEDGKRLPDALVGVPRPVDPGDHTYQATAPGLEATQTVAVKEATRQNVALALQPAAGGAAEPAAAPAPALPATTGNDPNSASGAAALDTSTSGMSGMRIASFVALGVGIIGVGAGTYFLVDAGSKQTDADNAFEQLGCGEDEGCPDDEELVNELDDEASSARTRATISFVVGGVGLATGAVLFFVSAKNEKSSAARHEPRIQPWIGFKSVGLSGTF